MLRYLLLGACAALSFSPAIAETAPDTPGADQHLRQVGETAILGDLIDPDSAKFQWIDKPFVTLTGFKSSLFARAIPGDVSFGCGRVNSRNRMGGYEGFSWFWVAIKDGTVVARSIDNATDEVFPAQMNCHKWGF